MSHCNITMRDRYSTSEEMRKRIIMLEAENRYLEMLLAAAESNLSSIFDRIAKGEDVYLDYPDGTRIDIKATEPRP